jgi:guanylate kinase
MIFEYVRPFSKALYGSPVVLLRSENQEPMAVELDPSGFVRVRTASARRVVGIFITTSSESELTRRLLARGQEQEISQRLRARTDQLAWVWAYDYVLFNDDRETFLNDLNAVVRSELLRTIGAQRALEL